MRNFDFCNPSQAKCSFLLFKKVFQLILLVRDLTLFVLARKQHVVYMVNFKLDFLHPEYTLDTWLGVEAEAYIQALHIVIRRSMSIQNFQLT